MPHFKAMGTFNHPDFIGNHKQGMIYEYEKVPQFMLDSGLFTLVIMDIRNEKEVFEVKEEAIHPIKEEPNTIKKEVADKIALEPIKDLRGAIGINDKFQFMETLFNKEEAVFESSIKTINAFKNFAEAQFWIKQNLRNKYHWDEESAVVIAFDQLVKRRFS